MKLINSALFGGSTDIALKEIKNTRYNEYDNNYYNADGKLNGVQK